MELERVDTKRAYEQIRTKITTLEMAPGQVVDEQAVARQLKMGLVPVREALKLLAHENLVTITPRHGIYVSDVNVPDLERLSEVRLALEGLCARLAAARATEDDLVVLEALRQQQAAALGQATGADRRHLIDVDHKFHQAVAQAAHNNYLEEALDRLFGLSQRLWYLALPALEFLAPAVEKHLDLVTAIREGDGDQAEAIMRDHVGTFYDKLRDVLSRGG